MKTKHYVIGGIVSLIAFFIFRSLFTTIDDENRTFDLSNSDWIDEETGIVLELDKSNGIMYFEEEEYSISTRLFSDSIKIFYSEDESNVFFNAKIYKLDEENMILLQSSDTITFVRY